VGKQLWVVCSLWTESVLQDTSNSRNDRPTVDLLLDVPHLYNSKL
jgi:hypothetical protein